MKVFKFGGASVRDVDAIKNVLNIVKQQGEAPLIIVVSAMAKSTNALENIICKVRAKEDFSKELQAFNQFHQSIAETLFNTDNPLFKDLESLYSDLAATLQEEYDHPEYFYDKVVCYGELLSTKIIQHYLTHRELPCQFLDARDCIITDNTFGEGKVQWDLTKSAIEQKVLGEHPAIYVTQGFIGSDKRGNTTTLGREGSDYTAAIFAFCLEATSVTIWKDVPGILNADPDRWIDTVKYASLSYGEAAEMTYYGATVIHPKTIRPLAVKNIPLVVKSFVDPIVEGTRIGDLNHEVLEPAIIFKPNQCLISFQVRDFTFINERKLSMIFHLFEEFNIKINMMQSSAISFSVCIDSPDKKLKVLINSLSGEFDIFYNDHLELVTIKNYVQELISKIKQGKQILLEQKSRKNYQMLTTSEISPLLV